MQIAKISPDNVVNHLKTLCVDIGCRLAGTENEAKAAQYIAEHFQSLGLAVEVQEFPCVCWSCERAELEVLTADGWQPVPVQPNSQSPATDGVIEGEIVYLETAQPRDLEGQDLQGKIGLLFGSAYASLERMHRLCNSGLAALLYVDDRFPFHWNVASGLIAGWIDHLTIPTATIPYMYAWDIVRNGLSGARLRLDMQTFLSTSQNVAATMPGTADLPPLVVGGHHDCVALGVGAEDDASGVIAAMEAARVLTAAGPLQRPVKFVTFGWEENLSEGARQYVINPENRAADTAFMFNVDSIGCWMGMNKAIFTGSPQLQAYLEKMFDTCDFTAEVIAEISPFSDHFAFNLLDVPSMWLYRTNFPGGRWYHHSDADRPDVLNPQRVAETIDVITTLLADLGGREHLPFDREIPAAQVEEIVQHRRDLYDCAGDWQTPGLIRPETGRRNF